MAWIFVGLGNPGYEYEGTRHNTGRMALESFAKSAKLTEWKEDKKAKALVSRGIVGHPSHKASAGQGKTLAALVLPNTFMNKSGAAVAKFVKSQKAAERMAIVYDDLDLPLGTMKISFNRGSGGHKGVESIMKAVKTKKFTRVRVGVSPSTASGALRKPVGEKVVVNFILTKFKAHELEELKKVFKRVSRALEVIATEGVGRAMNEFN
ncbi:MAG: aminoacyl-tRNA hydrolase [bacterium]|nr:aminoacyl-tRNA hydrolase [bacterium]